MDESKALEKTKKSEKTESTDSVDNEVDHVQVYIKPYPYIQHIQSTPITKARARA